MQHGARVGSADGPPSPSHRAGEGWVDLRRRRAWFPEARVVAGETVSAESFWDGPTLYVRFASDEPWRELPLLRVSGAPAGAVPYSSPLWLLDALCGACGDAQLVGDEEVRDIPTTQIRLTVDTARAMACSPLGLRFPPLRADAFPAEVWLDGDDRLRRMGCAWPTRRRLRLGSSRPHWITTELWDFGADVDSPPPPHSA
jgi:hypothetical protein